MLDRSGFPYCDKSENVLTEGERATSCTQYEGKQVSTRDHEAFTIRPEEIKDTFLGCHFL